MEVKTIKMVLKTPNGRFFHTYFSRSLSQIINKNKKHTLFSQLFSNLTQHMFSHISLPVSNTLKLPIKNKKDAQPILLFES